MSASDATTLAARRILQGLLADNPTTTLVGAGIGVGVATLYGMLQQPGAPSLPIWASIVFFAALFNVVSIFRRAKLPPTIQVALQVIERAKFDGLPTAQVNLMYRRLFDYALAHDSDGIRSFAGDVANLSTHQDPDGSGTAA